MVKIYITIILLISFIGSSKAQLIKRNTYIQLLHNKEVIATYKIPNKYTKVGDTISLGYNPRELWFKCSKNHTLDTMTVVRGKRYECRMGVVISKKDKQAGRSAYNASLLGLKESDRKSK